MAVKKVGTKIGYVWYDINAKRKVTGGRAKNKNPKTIRNPLHPPFHNPDPK